MHVPRVLKLLLALTVIIAFATPTPTMCEEVSTYPSNFQYTIAWKKWVLQVNISTETPWILGRVAELKFSLKLLESEDNSTLYITKISVKAPYPSPLGYHKEMASTYGGSFPSTTNSSTSTVKFRVVPEYFNIDSVGVKLTVDVPIVFTLVEETDHGLETSEETYVLTVEVVSVPSKMEASLDGAKSVHSGVEAPYTIRFRNEGPMPVYAVELQLLVDGKEEYREWIGDLDVGAGGTKHVTLRFDSVGPHLVTLKVNYQEFDGTPAHTEYVLPVYVYRRLEVSLYADRSSISINDNITFTVVTRPPPDEEVNAYLEVSTDLGSTWRMEKRIVVGANGTATINYTVAEPLLRGTGRLYFRVKVETPGSGGLLYSMSNVVVLEVERETATTQPPTTRPTATTPAEKVSLVLNANVTLASPGKPIEFTLEASPKTITSAALEKLSLGVWVNVAEIKLEDGVGKVVVKAPEEEGIHSYRAVVAIGGSEYVSNIVNVEVKGAPVTTVAPATMFPPELLGSLVATTAAASVVLWWRRRRR